MPGYDSFRDDTEHLVLWVNAPRKTAAKLFARSIGAEIESVEEITYKEEEGIDYWVGIKGNMTKIGKDVLDRQGGTCLCGHFDRCTHYNWRIKNGHQ